MRQRFEYEGAVGIFREFLRSDGRPGTEANISVPVGDHTVFLGYRFAAPLTEYQMKINLRLAFDRENGIATPAMSPRS